MKNVFKKSAVFLGIFGFVWGVACSYNVASAAQNTSSVKIAYVDLNKALNEVKEGKVAKQKLEAEGKAKKQKLQIMQNDLKKMRDDIAKQKLILSDSAMQAKQRQFQQKFLEFQKMSMQFEKDFANKQANYIKPISEKLKRVIEQIGKSGGYALIVPSDAALYSPSGTDITDEVISKYNKTK